jgi:hypothetical protein
MASAAPGTLVGDLVRAVVGDLVLKDEYPSALDVRADAPISASPPTRLSPPTFRRNSSCHP